MNPLQSLAGLVDSGATPTSDTMQWATGLLSGCWSCQILDTMSGIGLDMADQTFTRIASGATALIGLLMGLWILFLAGRIFMPFGPQGSAGSLWNEGARKLFQFALVLGFLQGSGAFWDYLFMPLISSGLAFASSIVSTTDAYELSYGSAETGPTSAASGYCQNAPATGQTGVAGAKAAMQQMDCPMAKIQSQFAKGMLIGLAVIQGSTSLNSILLTSLPIILRIAINLISGLCLIIAFFLGFLLFPMLMIDLTVRVAILAAFAPLAIAASLFKATGRIAEKAAWNLVQAALTMVFVSIVGGLGKACLAYVFSSLPNGQGGSLPDWQHLISGLESGQIQLDFTTQAFYELIGMAIILLYMLRQAAHMAADFTGSAATNFSGVNSGLATMAGAAGYAVGSTAQMGYRQVRNRLSRLAERVSGAKGSETSNYPVPDLEE